MKKRILYLSLMCGSLRVILKTIVRSTIVLLCVMSAAALSGCGGSPQTVPPLTIMPASLPNGTLGLPYNQAIQVSGGVAPFNWTVVGMLPQNLQLATSAGNTATISGTPDAAAPALTFSIEVTDSANQSAIQSYTVSILAEPNTLSFTPAAGLSFGRQLVGTASTTQAATLTNSGTSPIVVNNIATGGDFSQSNTCGSSVAAGAKCFITVIFTPSQMGPRSASITVADDTAGNPHLLALSGIGLTSGANATLSPTSLNFSSQSVGISSSPLSVTLSNYGTATLNIESIAATADFGETNSCGASLASGGSCPINVTFTPNATGSVTGTLSVTDNAPVSPQTVSLSGTCLGCIPQGGACFGPGPNNCCLAPRGHHSFCSNPTGWGTCTEN
jgi:Abnormal spindle-like microcephaly-assoc'd, ASPM-SPD-2-Hydin